MKKNAPTSYDVARLANVTQPTVSRAMRGERIAESTRQKILRIAKEIGYVPNSAGRSLATRKTSRIGLVLVNFQSQADADVISGFEKQAAREGYQVTIFRHQEDKLLFNQLSTGSLDAVAIASLEVDSKLPRMLRDRNIPTVLLNREISSLESDVCVFDNEMAGRIAAKRLLSLGHTRIGAIYGPEKTSTAIGRRMGFESELRQAGIEISSSAIRIAEFSQEASHDAFLNIVSEGDLPSAFFCSNDVQAIGVINACRGKGIRVPEDLSVIGVGNYQISAWESFDLTTVGQNLQEMSKIAANLLIERLKEGGSDGVHRRVILEPHLVVRSSDTAV